MWAYPQSSFIVIKESSFLTIRMIAGNAGGGFNSQMVASAPEFFGFDWNLKHPRGRYILQFCKVYA